MSFLKKLGQAILKGSSIVSGLTPYVQYVENLTPPNVDNLLEKAAHVIQQVEVMGQALSLPGTQKLQAATPLVAQLLLKSPLLANHKVQDPALFQRGAQKIADGVADLLNSLDEGGVGVVDKT